MTSLRRMRTTRRGEKERDEKKIIQELLYPGLISSYYAKAPMTFYYFYLDQNVRVSVFRVIMYPIYLEFFFCNMT